MKTCALETVRIEPFSRRLSLCPLPLLTVLLAVLCLSGVVQRAEAATSGLFTYRVLASGVEITDYPVTASGAVTIPPSIVARPVFKVAARAFAECGGITSVTIPASVKEIGDEAFLGCGRLQSILLSDGLERIGRRAFSGTELGVIFLPASLIELADGAFSGSGLLSINVSTDNLTYRGNAGVLFTRDATKLVAYPPGRQGGYPIPGGTVEVAAEAFATSLVTAVTIPSSVSEIGNYCFDGCVGLTALLIPDSVRVAGIGLCRNCISLTSLRIPDTVRDLTEMVRGCIILPYVDIPSSAVILSRAFQGCASLRSATVPAPAERMDWTFAGCSLLSSMNIPAGVREITGCFSGCTSLESIVLPAGLTVVGDEAFADCSALAFCRTGQGVTHLGKSSFARCTALPGVPLSLNLSSIGDQCFENCAFDRVVLPESVLSIGRRAFAGNLVLGTVRLPTRLAELDGVFAGCANLHGIALPQSLSRIGADTFRNCSAMRNLVIPQSVAVIGSSAFAGCSGLDYVFFQGDAPVVASSIYSGMAPQFRTCYPAGRQGFSSPLWQGYPCRAVGRLAPWLIDQSIPPDAALSQPPPGIGGATLLERYALGGDGQISLVQSPSEIGLEFTTLREDVTYLVETSQDLREWTTRGIELTREPGSSTLKASVPIAGGARYLRLRLELVP